jgi:hypothetical protein
MKTICYCYGYTAADIVKDIRVNNGHSSIAARITENRKNGTCQCDIKHPAKR